MPVRRISVLTLAALLAAGCGAGRVEDSRSSGTSQERRALLSFQAWLNNRTTVRQTTTGTETIHKPPTRIIMTAVSHLDFRHRQGEITTTTLQEAGNSQQRSQTHSQQIYWGADVYSSISPNAPSLLGPAVNPATHTLYLWSKSTSVGPSVWDEWSADERALNRVHAVGPVPLTTGPAHRFTGRIDTTTHKTISTLPRPGCGNPILTIDLYIDDRTGQLIRYDRGYESATARTAIGIDYRLTESFTEFGVQPPPLSLPTPSTIQPPVKVSKGGGVTFRATAVARTC